MLGSVKKEFKDISEYLYFFFFLDMIFPLILIKVSLNPEFEKLLIERGFAY